MPTNEVFPTQTQVYEQNLGTVDNQAEINRARLEQLRSFIPDGSLYMFENAVATLSPDARVVQTEAVGGMVDAISQRKSEAYGKVEERVKKDTATEVDLRLSRAGHVSDSDLQQRYGLGLFGRFSMDPTARIQPEKQREAIQNGWDGVLTTSEAAKKTVVKDEKVKWGNRASELVADLIGDPSTDAETKAYIIAATFSDTDAVISDRLTALELLLHDHRTRKTGGFIARISAGAHKTRNPLDETKIEAELRKIEHETSNGRLELRLHESLRKAGIETWVDQNGAVLRVKNRVLKEMSEEYQEDPQRIRDFVFSKTDEYVHRLVASAAAAGPHSNPQGNRREVASPPQSSIDREISTLREQGMSDKQIKTQYARAALTGDPDAVEKLKAVNAALRPRGSQEHRN